MENQVAWLVSECFTVSHPITGWVFFNLLWRVSLELRMQCAEREGGWRPHLRMHGLRKCIQPAAPTLPFDGFVHLQENAHPGLRRQHSLSPVIIGRRQFIASHNWSNTFIMSHNWSKTVYNHDSLLVKHSLSLLIIGQTQFIMTQNWSKTVYHDSELVKKSLLWHRIGQ